MIEALSYDFMRQALLVGLLASIACGIIGTYVVVKRLVALSGGISHAAYGGVGLGYFLGFDPLAGALIFSLGAAFALGVAHRRTGARFDTVIGIIWACGMAVGIILVNLTPGYAPDLMSYLFGNILTVGSRDLSLLALLDAVVVLLTVVFYHHFLVVSFDEEFALLSGVIVPFYYYLMLCLVALTVVILIRVVGIILVIALLSIPAALANEFSTDLKKIMGIAIALGIVFTTGGLFISYFAGSRWGINLPSGATIILLAVFAYPLSLVVKKYLLSRQNH